MMSFAPDPNSPPAYVAPKKGWFGRNWLWLVPSIVLLPICLCGGICGGGFLYLRNQIVSSGAYTVTLEKVRENEEVKAALGEPIEETMMTFGGITPTSDGGSHATVVVRLQGPKGAAMVESESRQAAGAQEWEVSRLIVRPDGGAPITIVGPQDGSIDLQLEEESPADMEGGDRAEEQRAEEESTTEEPGADNPAAQEPATEAPQADEPATEEPAAEPAEPEQPE